MNPQILAILQQHGFFAGMQPTVPVMPTPSPASLLGSVGATPNGPTPAIPGPSAAALPADPNAPTASFGDKYGPLFQQAAQFFAQRQQQRQAPPPQPAIRPLIWHSQQQGGSY